MNSDCEEADIACSDNSDDENSTDYIKPLEGIKDINDKRVKLLRQGVLMSEIISEPICKKRHQRR